jgi:hypothetical protein
MEWWWRLQLLGWTRATKDRPARRGAALLLWWLPCVVVPAITSLDGAASSKALGLLLSVDVPLTLLAAVGVLLDALRTASRRGAEDWLWPRAFQPARVRWLARMRWLVAIRWPAGLVLATLLLASGTTPEPGAVGELVLMASLALIVGGAVIWAFRHSGTETQNRPATSPRTTQGMAALSWVPLLESRERFDLRRMTILSVPILLAAPAGVLAIEVAGALAIFLPAMFIVVVCQECVRTQACLHRWLPTFARSRVKTAYWVWRYVAPGIAALMLAIAFWFVAGRRFLVSPH